jgi:predicted enzyme related to lactoylglutathione lyase
MAGEVVHIEFPSENADRAQAFWSGLFDWQFGDPMEGMDYRPGHGWFAACKDSEGNAFHLWQADASAS